jgi:ABC-type hemin transport system substrate-binding protein
MTRKELERLADHVDQVAQALERRWSARVKELNEEVQALKEERKGWRGIYRAGETYRPGETVTHAGTLWSCREHTGTRPGTGAAWAMMVKTPR